MTTDTFSKLMLIKSPTVDNFDPKDAIDAWMSTPSGKSQRPQFVQGRSKRETLNRDSAEEETDVKNTGENLEQDEEKKDAPNNEMQSNYDENKSGCEQDEDENETKIKKYMSPSPVVISFTSKYFTQN